MVTQNMVVSLPKTLPPDGVYRGCVLGKHHHAPFDLEISWHVQNQLELVHSDLCCMNKPSLLGVKYILTFIDDLSIFSWVYFLKNKSLVFEKFKQFRVLVEKKYGQHIKCLKSDNSGEYENRQVKHICLTLVSLGSDLSLILLNIMVWLKGRTIHWLRWLTISYRLKTY
jgi:hypothetical protein